MYARIALLSLLTAATVQASATGWSPPARWDIPVIVNGENLEKAYPLIADTGAGLGQEGWVRAVQVCVEHVGSQLTGWLGLSDARDANPNTQFVLLKDVSAPRLPKCFRVAIPKHWKAIYLHTQNSGFPSPNPGTKEPECSEQKNESQGHLEFNKNCVWGTVSIDSRK